MFKVNVIFKPKKKSLVEISEDLYSILVALRQVDPFFESPLLRQDKFDDYSVNLKNTRKLVVDQIAQTLLEFSLEDIAKYESVVDPSINYNREFGFSILLQYKQGKKELSFSIKLGSSTSNGMGILSSNGMVITYNMANRILVGLIENAIVLTGSIKISNLNFLRNAKKYKYPLGLVTYFRNDIELVIPKELVNMTIENFDSGTYIILDEKIEQDSVSATEEMQTKILEAMEHYLTLVPEYER